MEEVETDPIEAVITLDPNTSEFTANGTTYFVAKDIERLTIARYERYEQFNIELGFSLSFDSLFAAIRKAATDVFTSHYETAYIELKNIERGISTISENRNSIALYMCTLFINRAGEDLSDWSPDLADEKIQDWQRENIAVGFFLGVALSMVEGYKTAFNSILADYSALSQLSQSLIEKAQNESL